MKKIGIMGGTFNPVHNAHLAMAQAACEQYELDRVLFMPSKNPPHKKKETLISEEHRKRMVQLAIDGNPNFKLSEFELEREGTTYTCETLKLLKKKHPDWELFFILGGDSLLNFAGWYHPEEIVNECTILAVPRDGLGIKETKKNCRQLMKQFSGRFLPVHLKHLKISSSDIRKKIRKGQALTGICPDKVCRYIELHGLYGSDVYMYPEDYLKKYGIVNDVYESLSSTLRPNRYIHTLGVAHTASLLASCCGSTPPVERLRAETAGLLHDCAKYLSGDEMIALCDEKGIELSEFERENDSLIHGKLGAYLAETRFGIRDEEILSAICFHTTGKPDMTTLEKIIYVADYIEPGRDMECHPYPLEQVRRTCFDNLDEGLLMILTNTIDYLKREAIPIDEMSIQTYEYYKNLKH